MINCDIANRTVAHQRSGWYSGASLIADLGLKSCGDSELDTPLPNHCKLQEALYLREENHACWTNTNNYTT